MEDLEMSYFNTQDEIKSLRSQQQDLKKSLNKYATILLNGKDEYSCKLFPYIIKKPVSHQVVKKAK